LEIGFERRFALHVDEEAQRARALDVAQLFFGLDV
jgi:hypothetical protein